MAVSRGTLTSATFPVVVSMLTTIRVSVSRWARPVMKSVPTARNVIRVGLGVGAAVASIPGPTPAGWNSEVSAGVGVGTGVGVLVGPAVGVASTCAAKNWLLAAMSRSA